MRLKNAFIIKGESVDKDPHGNIQTIYCTYDPESRSGSGTEASMRKVKEQYIGSVPNMRSMLK